MLQVQVAAAVEPVAAAGYAPEATTAAVAAAAQQQHEPELVQEQAAAAPPVPASPLEAAAMAASTAVREQAKQLGPSSWQAPGACVPCVRGCRFGSAVHAI